MIGYPISSEKLKALIESDQPGWLKKAADRTKTFRKKKTYSEKTPIWSLVKPTYMKLQGHSKCAYCERKMESIDYGKGEQDIEHFRPKGNVREWPLPDHLTAQGIKATRVLKKKGGYYLLPYHSFNYAAACKPCNSALKSDCFPIAGNYSLKGDDPSALLKEQPFLVYPIGDFDESPESLIHFYGVSPQAVVKSGHKRNRALVTIEFFKLDDAVKRKNLLLDRANVIVGLYPQLEKVADGATGPDRSIAIQLIDSFMSPKGRHTNCARCFKELFEQNRAEAKTLFESAVNLVISSS